MEEKHSGRFTIKRFTSDDIKACEGVTEEKSFWEQALELNNKGITDEMIAAFLDIPYDDFKLNKELYINDKTKHKDMFKSFKEETK